MSRGRIVGRYAVYDEIACGGMASVRVGRLLGPVGFSRTVAIKCLHPQFAKDPEFVAMFLDEARLAARIRHPNVVSTIDVVALEGELFLVMDYVQGESLSRLLRCTHAAGGRIPPEIAVAILADALHGLHAAHEAKNERDESLDLVHRDVSPQNVLVGSDGVSRVLDFGIAKAASRVQTTREGQLKGKLAYMAPEQLLREPVDRRTDVFAMSIVLWETLTGSRLFSADDVGGTLGKILSGEVIAPSKVVPGLPSALDAVVLQGLARHRERRFATAKEMALAVESALPPARPAWVGDWVGRMAGEALGSRAKLIADIESGANTRDPATPALPDTPTAPTELVGKSAAPSPESVDGQTLLTSSGATRTPTSRRTLLRPALAVGGGILASGLAVVAIRVLGAPRVDARSAAALSPAASEWTPQVARAGGQVSFDAGVTVTSEPAATVTDGIAGRPPNLPVREQPISTAQPRKRALDCNPPYYFDSDKVKRFKPGCL